MNRGQGRALPGGNPGGTIVAVVVTRHRRDLLAKSLAVIAAQTRPPDHLVVVDNGPDEPAADVVADCLLPSTYLLSQRNLGGAGGFALGILHALAMGAHWVWLADDDGRPADVRVLQTLLEESQRRGLAVVSPVVVNINDPERLAFPLRRGLTWKRHRSELGEDFLPGIASFFNGALFSAAAIDVVGVPDYRLFVRGDEVEVHRRVVRSGLRFGTSLRAAYAHPDGSAEFKPMLRGHFHAQDPEDEAKRYYTYRNRGYLLSQPGMRLIGALELFRFGLYFLGTRRDPRAFARWLRLLRQGRAERFYRHGTDRTPRGAGSRTETGHGATVGRADETPVGRADTEPTERTDAEPAGAAVDPSPVSDKDSAGGSDKDSAGDSAADRAVDPADSGPERSADPAGRSRARGADDPIV